MRLNKPITDGDFKHSYVTTVKYQPKEIYNKKIM